MVLPSLLTTRMVAEVLQITLDSARELIAHGHLEAVNVSLGSKRPRWRVTPEALEQFLRVRGSRANVTPKPARKPRTPDRIIKFY